MNDKQRKRSPLSPPRRGQVQIFPPFQPRNSSDEELAAPIVTAKHVSNIQYFGDPALLEPFPDTPPCTEDVAILPVPKSPGSLAPEVLAVITSVLTGHSKDETAKLHQLPVSEVDRLIQVVANDLLAMH